MVGATGAGSPDTQPSRRLAAIMFTDLVGYSDLSHRDEPLALELLRLHRDWVREILPRHGGREIGTVGDAFLVEFSGALAAVECARAIQRRFAEHNAGADASRRMVLRIGIHIGDVEFRDGNVLGDGVNIASRIQSMAEPGTICVSEQVYYAVRNHPGFDLRSLGTPRLKNISTPLEVFRLETGAAPAAGPARAPRPPQRARRRLGVAAGIVVLAGLAGVWWLARPAPPEQTPSVAVLPFENLSADPENAFFTDGLHDTVIGHLARVKGLKVISRTSVMGFRGKHANLHDVARALDVTSILEGSVQRTGGRLRVVAQLIDARTDAHVWSNEYERDVADVFAVQADIARQVAEGVHARLTPQQRARIERVPTNSAEAYDLYLKAMLAYREWSSLSNERSFEAVRWLDQAVTLDPDFALAWALLTYMNDALYWSGVDPVPARHKLAVAAADKALQLDPGLAEAHVARAIVLYHERQYDAALAALAVAGELAPGDGDVYLHRGAILRRQGRWMEAAETGQHGLWLDPLNVKVLDYYVGTLRALRRYREADQILARIEPLASNAREVRLRRALNRFHWTGDLAAYATAVEAEAGAATAEETCFVSFAQQQVYAMQGRLTEAAEALLSCPEDFPESPKQIWAALDYHDAGDLVRARRYGAEGLAILEKLPPDSAHRGHIHMMRAFALVAIGDGNAALRAADEALRETPVSVDAVVGADLLPQAAEVHAMVGERERALEEIARALALPNGGHAHELRLSPGLRSLRDDPRFQKLMADHRPRVESVP